MVSDMSAPMPVIQPVSHVSLPQHMAAVKDMLGSFASDRIHVSASTIPTASMPTFPISYAAVVQPTLIPPAVVNSSQHACTVQPALSAQLVQQSKTAAVSTALPVHSHIDLVSDHQSDMPSVTLHDMPASDFLQQFVQACMKPHSYRSLDHKVKFRMEASEKVKGVHLRKGERLTSALVLQWVAAARVLGSAALKARSREPEAASEWATFFKFYVDHMEDGLQEVMMSKVSGGQLVSVADFWNAVFKELFPEALVKDAFEEALKEYPIWAEPMGLERWEKVTRLLVQYQAMVAGNSGANLQFAIAERMYEQLLRVVHLCKERPSQDLLR